MLLPGKKNISEFLTRPQNLEVLEGDKAEFACSVSKEAITVQWLRGDTVLEPGDKYDIISDGKRRTLVVKDSILGDAGKYTVMVGEAKATARLTVIGKFYFMNVQVHILFLIITPLKDQEVNEGQEIIFNCEVNKEGAKEKWYKNDEAIFDSAKYIIVQKDLVYTLRIRDAQLKDQATYTISLSNQRGEHVKSSAALTVLGCELSSLSFFVLTEEDLRIVEPLEDIETMEKKTVTFWCKVNRLNATLKWTKNGEEITFNKRILYKIDKYKHSLIIKDCGFIDEGEYTVTAGQDKSVAELLITEAPADFIEHLRDQTVTEFDDAVFTCQLSKEKASVRWYRNGREIKEGKKYQFEKDGNLHRLIIKDCRLDDECEYSCGVDDRKSRARLFVEDIYEAPGADVIFMAELNKDGVEVKWLRNNMIIVQGDKHQMMSEGKVHRLQVCEIKPRDQGEYRFIAKDKEARAKLELAGKFLALSAPRIKTGDQNLVVDVGKPLTMTVPYDAYPRAEAEWLKEEESLPTTTVDTTADCSTFKIYEAKKSDKGRYKVILRNKHGQAEAFINVEVIGKNLEVTETYDGEVGLAWQEPESDGGSKILGYVIERRDIKRKTWIMVTDRAENCEYTVTGLQKGGVEYLFRVSARNRVGTGEPVETERPVEAKIPGPPQNVEVTDVNRFGATLTWEPPEYDGGSPITGYVIELRNRASIKWEPTMTTGADELSAVLTDVVENEEYFFRVRAQNMVGVGKPSPATRAVKIMDPIGKCASPDCGYIMTQGHFGCLYITLTGKPEPQITWTKADKILRPDNRITIETKPNHSTVTITDSKRSDSGTYIIEAVNSSGRATAVVEVNVLDKPGPPAAFDVSEITNESCLLTWNPPRDDGGSKITNYVLEKRATDSEIWHKLSSTIKDTKFRATNLTPHKEYVFRVSAENMYGIGEPAQCEPIIAKYSFGQKLSIPVPFRAVPSPTITWHKDGKELKAGDRTTMKSDYTSALLEVIDSVHADAGVYTITLENKLASTTGSVNVKVIGN
uniref:Titin n=1 Tax=Calidris pygmaea TaxID=425635 RepID=A0A8C3KHS4_9CHAR